MPRPYRPPTVLTARGQTYTFPAVTLDSFPGAGAFLTYLLDRGRVTPATATHYVKIIGRLLRNGRIVAPTNPVAATAANAYHRWTGEAYGERVRPVALALGTALHTRAAITWLRRGSLVAPSAGKQVPQVRLDPTAWERMKAGDADANAAVVTWVPSNAWTLHVPRNGKTPVHLDPCPDCVVIELTAEQVEETAKAFEAAWGHRDLNAVPNEAFLFGDPAPEYTGDEHARPISVGRVLALVEAGPLADALRKLGAIVVGDADAYGGCVQEGAPDTVVISRKTCGDAYDKLLGAVHESWSAVPGAEA